MTTLCSYDLNGKKLSFANWISNLSPQETPFTSMTGKESINQTLFQWQTDALAAAGDNALVEGAQAEASGLRTTSVKQNITQILRKTVKVSDTANALANYGRGKELQYQMEKAGKEIKRDLEYAFLSNVGSRDEDAMGGRETAGFRGLVAAAGAVCPETKAVVNKTTAASNLTETELFDLTYNLYLAGARTNIIMFHPKHAGFFSSLQEASADPNHRQRIFENTPKFSVYVSTLIDPLGQEYKLLPNRWMPEESIYFLNPADWTQMVLRSPQRTKLAKDGSYEKWMIEMEVGLRHRHPFASGVLNIKASAPAKDLNDVNNTNVLDGTTKAPEFTSTNNKITFHKTGGDGKVGTEAIGATIAVGAPLKLKGIKSATGSPDTIPPRISVLKDGKEVYGLSSNQATTAADATAEKTVLSSVTMADSGIYTVQVVVTKNDVRHVYESYGMNLEVLSDNDVTAPPVRAAKAAAVEAEVVVEAASEEAPVKAARKSRAKKA